MNTYSSKFLIKDIGKIRKFFEAENAVFSKPQYMLFQARGNGFTASFYNSGKFVIQGNNTEKIVRKYFEPNLPFDGAQTSLNLQMQTPKTQTDGQIAPYPHIGIDESGKGDFFGPLVIAGVYLDEKGAEILQKEGVTDSKKMNDKKILSLQNLIKEVGIVDIIAISPNKYNELYSKFKNLNRLLAWGHATVLENILSKTECKIGISDKFADEKVIEQALKERGKGIQLIQQTKAESDTAVAAASVIARGEFVKRMSNIMAQYEITLPKGASNLVLDTGKKFVKKFGEEELKNVAKLHFKTYQDIKAMV